MASLGDQVVPVTLTGPAVAGGDVAAVVLADEAGPLAATGRGAAEGVRLPPVWDTYLMGYARATPAGVAWSGRAAMSACTTAPATPPRCCWWTAWPQGSGELAPAATGAGAERLGVTVAPFGQAGSALRAAVESAAARLATQTGHADVRLGWPSRRARHAAGARNAFMAPVRLGGPEHSRLPHPVLPARTPIAGATDDYRKFRLPHYCREDTIAEMDTLPTVGQSWPIRTILTRCPGGGGVRG